MKELIERIECGSDTGECFTLICKEHTIHRRNGETETETPLMRDDLDRLLNQVCRLIEENPDAKPVLQPYHSAVYLHGDEAAVIPLPYSKLNQLLDDAWFDAERVLAAVSEMPLMGLVQCPTAPSAPSGLNVSPMMQFMGMNAAEAARKQAEMQAEMIEQLHAKGVDEEAAERRKLGARIDQETWNCGCGQQGLHSKFCPACGQAAPPPLPETWDCPNCGAKDLHSKFCPECGTQAKE